MFGGVYGVLATEAVDDADYPGRGIGQGVMSNGQDGHDGYVVVIVRNYDPRSFGACALQDAVVARWPFDEGTGSTTSGVDGAVGTLHNMTSSNWIVGESGYGLAFNGSGQYVDFSPVATETGSFSLLFFVRPGAAHETDAESATGYGGASG